MQRRPGPTKRILRRASSERSRSSSAPSKKFGPPIYVRHEIVHNRHVVENLRTRGAVFVDELEEIPPGAMTIFSAHGVAKRVEEAARPSAICRSSTRHARWSRRCIMRAAATRRRIARSCWSVMPAMRRWRARSDKSRARCIWCRQSRTWPNSTSATRRAGLHHPDDAVGGRHPRRSSQRCRRAFPAIVGPDVRDICYATQNRQQAVRELAKQGRHDPGRRFA